MEDHKGHKGFTKDTKETSCQKKINYISNLTFTAMHRSLVVLYWLIFNIPSFAKANDLKEVYSPDKKIKLSINANDRFLYSVEYNGKAILSLSTIDLILDNGTTLSGSIRFKKTTVRSNNSIIVSPVPEKRRNIPDVYTELRIELNKPFTVVFRVYNDGVAYRIETRFRDSIIIKNEIARFSFVVSYPVYYPEVVKRADADIYHTSFEEPYQLKPMDSICGSSLAFTPILVAPSEGPKVFITESDLEDYPGMFLRGTSSPVLEAEFAPYPLEEKIAGGEFTQYVVSRRAGYIAHTRGTRTFPWRVIGIASQDKELPNNDIVYRLGAPSRVPDVSWIHPGKGTDEWIIGINLFNVNFKAGINTATYKYYIDFAKRFGLDRIMMDAGWSDSEDLFRINPAIDMDEISRYAKSKGIRLSMWTLAMTLDKQLEAALDQFNKWGVDFIMTDFMDRDDQKTVNFYYRVAEACARHKIMIMYHGAFKPAGFNRTYPNAITREAVLGSEYNIWSEKATPEHNLLLPFIRMTAGSMDYEPGILDNATQKTFRPIGEKVMSLGTRTQQLAMFIVYESPIQLFSGNPSQALLEPRFMELLGSIPTTWDDTRILEAKLGDYIITARKKGKDWFIGAMTDSTARDFTVNLDFLEEGEYTAEICTDGLNADRYPSDYKMDSRIVSKTDSLNISMASGGGYVVRLIRR
jgi:alpha-glucosidase